MKKSYAVIFAIFCMSPALFGCLKCADITPMETDIKVIRQLIETAKMEEPKNRRSAWEKACNEFPRLKDRLDDHKRTIEDKVDVESSKDPKKERIRKGALLAYRRFDSLKKEMTTLCQEAIDRNADMEDISSTSGRNLKNHINSALELIDKGILEEFRPALNELCHRNALLPPGSQSDPRVCGGQKNLPAEPVSESAPGPTAPAPASAARG